MKNNSILTIMKKELARFFGDKRMAFTTVLLPGLLIFVMYTFMGDALMSQFEVEDTFVASAQVENAPQWILAMDEKSGFAFTATEESGRNSGLTAVSEKELDLYVVFAKDFEGTEPKVEVYFNSSSTESQQAYSTFMTVMDAYEGQRFGALEINMGEAKYDLASEKDMTGFMFSSLLPMLLLTFLYSGSIAVAPESIAGEKERGTIATLLITPVRRSHIALGKIFALSVIALLSGISSAAGTILSLPKLMGPDAELNGNFYTVGDYMMLGVVILSTVLVLVTLISLISAFAKNTKEAQTYVMPLMIVNMLVGLTAMFGSGAQEEFYYYLIPVYNSVQCMVGIFSFESSGLFILLTALSNLAVALLGVWGLTRMFHSERIVFDK